jgi:di/tricarboxylate transporter
MADSTITFIIIGVIVALFVTNRFPVAMIAIGTAVALWATGVLELDEALAGFGDPTVLFIAALVRRERGARRHWCHHMGRPATDRSGRDLTDPDHGVRDDHLCAVDRVRHTERVGGRPGAGVVVIAVRVGQNTSQLLIPVAYAAHAGALLALTGSPVSVIVSEAADDAGAAQFGFFEFALTGIPLLIGTIAIVVVLGPKLLPHRNASGCRPTCRARGDAGGAVSRRRRGLRPTLQSSLRRIRGDRAAALVADRQRAYPGMRTESGELVIVAVMREERRIDDDDHRIAAGDTLLVRGTWQALSEQIDADDECACRRLARRGASPGRAARTRRQGVDRRARVDDPAARDQRCPPAIAGLGAAGALVLLRLMSVEQAYRAIGWTTVILVAGMIPLSTAMRVTGAAEPRECARRRRRRLRPVSHS